MSIESNSKMIEVKYSPSNTIAETKSYVRADHLERQIDLIEDQNLQHAFEGAKLNAETKVKTGEVSPNLVRESLQQAKSIAKEAKVHYPEKLAAKIIRLAEKNSPKQEAPATPRGVSEGPNGRNGSAFQPHSKDLPAITGGR